ncbi:MAG: hypothetical protein RBR45_06310 [Pseudomonas sp.]|jgi:hypothetical protein|nr:hypothetical protein [Pseudomonas sp.]
MSTDDEEQQPIDQATVQPLAKVGEGCLSRFDPDALNEQQGADFSAAEQFRKQVLAEYDPVQKES